jgi:hypothetical protein
MKSFGLEGEGAVTLPTTKWSHNKNILLMYEIMFHITYKIHAYGSAVFVRWFGDYVKHNRLGSKVDKSGRKCSWCSVSSTLN